MNEQLSQRIAELGVANTELEAFSYTVSHDLRAPLRQVLGFINLMKKTANDQLPSSVLEYFSLIESSVSHMGQLIDDLLEFSRVGRTRMTEQPLDVRNLLDQAVQTLQPATDGRTIEWQINSLPAVCGDPALLRQVWTRLLENALKFTRSRECARIEVGAQAEESEYVFYVRDNGVGFDPRYADKLFGVFQRLHARSEFEGTGIGLANVRRIITRHGGRAWAESTLGQGATIYFSLPRSFAIQPVVSQP